MVTFWQTRLKQLTNHWTSGPLMVFLFLDKSRFIHRKNIIQGRNFQPFVMTAPINKEVWLKWQFISFQFFQMISGFYFKILKVISKRWKKNVKQRLYINLIDKLAVSLYFVKKQLRPKTAYWPIKFYFHTGAKIMICNPI